MLLNKRRGLRQNQVTGGHKEAVMARWGIGRNGLALVALCAVLSACGGANAIRDDMRETPFPSEEVGTDVASQSPLVDENGVLLQKDLSDENDFVAVSERESIESDAERLAQNRSVYRLIEPTDVPLRPETNIPNIVAYALQTTNPVGVQLYERGFLASEERSLIRCHKYQSPARAQEAFLAKGGPKRDRLGLDHDGDGFACSWDPTPFRLALSE